MAKIDIVFGRTEVEEKTERDNAVQCAIQFMQALITWKGAEGGLQVWEAMFEQMPEFSDIKADVLFAMLTGNVRKVTATIGNPANWNGMKNKVSAIRAVRAATHWGLKEAKDWVDAVETTGRGTLEVDHATDRVSLIRELRDCGLTIT